MSKASQHPTGIAGLLVSLVLVVAARLGVDFTPEEVAVISGLVVAAVSLASPRVQNLPVGGVGVGPDPEDA